jgi:BioD-like phosphotransacetylase family protein
MKKFFIAATKQNDGKTTLCLGLIAALRKRLGNIGFIKPVGQRYVVRDGMKVDEDSLLVEEIYDLQCHLQDTSPVAIEKGFTERYVRGGDAAPLEAKIRESFDKVAEGKDLVVVEGTGHAGVGSVFDLSNARVAKILGAKAILVTTGGIGKPIDQIVLNKALFDEAGVELIGVILNKVLPAKYDRIREVVAAGLARKGIRLLGALPYRDMLGAPTFAQVVESIDGQLQGGEEHVNAIVEHIVVGAMQAREALNYFKPQTLVITPGDRDDIVLATMNLHLLSEDETAHVAGLVLTGGLKPHPRLLDLLRQSRIPVALTQLDTFSAAYHIREHIYKIRPCDAQKIAVVESLVEEHVDLDAILDAR